MRQQSLPRRHGKVLVLVAFTLTVLLGMVGLTVDTGLLQAGRRQVQNAADVGALVAAMELYRGNTLKNAVTIATNYIKNTANGMTDPGVTIAIQTPKSGPYTNNSKYVEVILTAPQTAYLMPILGVSATQTVAGRAVAGYEPIASGEGLILLSPTAIPGLYGNGNTTVTVNGAIVVNSPGGGGDQYGNTVSGSGYAIDIKGKGNNPGVIATAVLVHGGVNDSTSAYANFNAGKPTPLSAGIPFVVENPLRNLPVPDASNGAVVTLNKPAAVTVTSKTPQTLNPGVYNDITVNSNATVTFNPGIYIISPDGVTSNQGLTIASNATVNGAGVMFYLTGSTYLSAGKAPGYWDKLDTPLDGPLPPTNGSIGNAPDPPQKLSYARLTIGGSSGTLTGLNDVSSPFNGILFYMRPRASYVLDQNAVSTAGSGASGSYNLGGTLYAQWANLDIGSWNYNGQLLVGSLHLNGNSDLVINPPAGKSFGIAQQVFLVE
jgi:Flp pilus assembly protein TadG